MLQVYIKLYQEPYTSQSSPPLEILRDSLSPVFLYPRPPLPCKTLDLHTSQSYHAGNEESVQFRSRSPDTSFDEPVSALIVMTTIEACLTTQVRLPKCHTYFMPHHIQLTKYFFWGFSVLKSRLKFH